MASSDTKIECLVCGKMTTHKNKTCSKACRQIRTRYEKAMKSELKSSESPIVDLFQGEILQAWRDESCVYLSFGYPGVTINFYDADMVDVLLEDLVNLVHGLTCSHHGTGDDDEEEEDDET